MFFVLLRSSCNCGDQVGRAARQGRSGTAFNLVDSEELPYMVELFLFLGRKLEDSDGVSGYDLSAMTPSMVHYGGLPQHLLDEENESLRLVMERNGKRHRTAS